MAAMVDAMRRDEFERDLLTGHFETDARNTCKNEHGSYMQDRIQARWEGWQAAIRNLGHHEED